VNHGSQRNLWRTQLDYVFIDLVDRFGVMIHIVRLVAEPVARLE
jgi:hypothetical protein